MNFVVVGANGLVGSRLVSLLLKQGNKVTAIGRGANRSAAKTWLSIDLAESEKLSNALAMVAPEVVINCSAMTDVDGCEREPEKAYAANVSGVAALARGARQAGAHLVHVSTDYVFDGSAGPYDVDATPNPRGIYALTKQMGDETVRALMPVEKWTIARTAVVYGWPPAGNKNFGSWLVDTLGKGQTVKLFDDQWVSPSLALNVAQMLAELGARKLPGIWHTCGADVVDRVTFGKALCERFGFDPGLIQPSKMADVKLLSPRPPKSGLIVKKTQQQLSAKPWALGASLDAFFEEVKGKPA
jgi:dTDP-4-dehydrorhamnose reductase